MKTKQAIVILTAVLGTASAGAEVGGRYEDSVRKHGKPIGKSIKKDQVVYLFQIDGSIFREEYNLEGKCITSDFGTHSLQEEITEPTPEPTPEPVPEPIPEPVPEPIPEPEQEPRKADQKPVIMWVLLPSFLIFGALVAFMMKKKESLQRLIRSYSLAKKPALTVANNDEKTGGTKIVLPTALRKEASAKLSPNEICFFKALQKAVGEAYIITFHVDLERVIDLNNPQFEEYDSDYKKLNPVFVDFVLHNPHDTSVAAVILLRDTKTEHPYQIHRRRFLHNILNENNTPLIEINENYEYQIDAIKKVIFKSSKENAA